MKELAIQIVQALANIHEKSNYSHSAITPSQILLDQNGKVTVKTQ